MGFGADTLLKENCHPEDWLGMAGVLFYETT